mgnify:CR=1 FL=1
MPSRILKLNIANFRGIKELTWRPAPGLNLVLGGGDAGKTTVLDAINILFSPAASLAVTETDYWMRNLEHGFCIECVMQLGSEVDINNQSLMIYPWLWNGEEEVLPDPGSENDDGIEVYKFRFSASDQQESTWEIVQPDGGSARLSVGLRRQIGLISLPSDDRNDKDLRLVYGSALDRHIGDPALRSRIGSKVAGLNLQDDLSPEGKAALTGLDARFKEKALPTGISIGLASSQGVSIGSLVGLLAERADDISLPLSSWGAGTRRLASLEVGAAQTAAPSLITIDEIERGLEPYRLRQFLMGLSEQDGQAFITTHSPVAISCVQDAHMWYLDSSGNLGQLPPPFVEKQQKNDPETFLARVAVIAEGVTEVGFLSYLLEKALGHDPLDHGIRICNGQGNDHTCLLLQALDKSGLKFAGLADNEGSRSGIWADLKSSMTDRLLQWNEGCTEEAVISAIPDARIPDLIGTEADEAHGVRLRHLQERIGAPERSMESIEAELATIGKSLKELVIEAASGANGSAPEGEKKAWKSHSAKWFKSELGGRELAEKALSLGAWDGLSPRVLPFLAAILASVNLTISENIQIV